MLAVLVALSLMVASGRAEKRVALIVGCDYKGTGLELVSPIKDAEALAQVLRTGRLGFADQDVEVLRNPNFGELTRAIDAFGQRLKSEEAVGLFYFSGHGAQHEGRNYLIPAGANIGFVEDLPSSAVAASRIVVRMEAANSGVNLVFLDACRSNALPSAAKGLRHGLNQMTGGGVLIGFAADANKEAYDSGDGSYYTNALLEHIKEPGISIFEMLTKVRADVRTATEGQQEPFMYSGLNEVFSFIPRGGAGPDLDPDPPASVGSQNVALGGIEGNRSRPEEMVRQAVITHTGAASQGKIGIELFADRVNYFDRMLDRQMIVVDELLYAFRWNESRRFEIDGPVHVEKLGASRYRAVCTKSYRVVGRGAERSGRIAATYLLDIRDGLPLITALSGKPIGSSSPIDYTAEALRLAESAVRAYLAAGDSDSVVPQSWFCADTLRDYFGGRDISQAEVANDMVDYKRRYPTRSHRLNSPISVRKIHTGRYSARVNLTQMTADHSGNTRSLTKNAYFELDSSQDIPRISVVRFE